MPIEIEKLTKLQELNLIDNDFEGIPEEVLQREAKEIIQYILAWQHKSLISPKISPCCRRQWHPVKVHAWTA